jgi:hypothetical protein
MFTGHMPLLRKRWLLLTISLVEGDTIRATVVPQKASEAEDNSLTTLDAHFGDYRLICQRPFTTQRAGSPIEPAPADARRWPESALQV